MIFADIIVRGKPVIKNLMNGSSRNTTLIVTGGSSKGSRAAGMVCAMEALGLTESFEAAYGVSSGLASIIYFLAGQALLGTSIYYEDITDNRYASFARWPFIDMDYLVNEVIAKNKPLAVDKIKNSPTKIKFPVTDSNGKPTFFTLEKDVPTFKALRLATSIFLYAGDGASWNGKMYFDGYLSEPIPFRKAIEDGHKDIIVLLNMPFNWDDKDDNLLLKCIKWPFMQNKDKNFRYTYFSRQKRYKEQLNDLCIGKIPKDVNITIIAPSSACCNVPFYTRSKSLIRRSVSEGILIIEEAFSKKVSVKLL